jgi:Tfp pilus assembly protein PilF
VLRNMHTDSISTNHTKSRRAVRLVASTIFVSLLFGGTAAFAQSNSSQQLTMSGYRSMQTGDSRTAVAYLTKAIFADPANLQARRLLAHCELQSGRAKRAHDIIKPVVAVDPSSDNLACLGDALFAMGQVDPARQAYQQASFSTPGHTAATKGLINVAVASQDFAEAKSLCRQALSTTQDSGFVKFLNVKLSELAQYDKVEAKAEG